MIISVALLGFGVSGVVLALSKKLQEIETDFLISVLSLAYGISVMISFILINKIPFDPFSLMTNSVQFVYLPLYYLLITIPFFFSGLIISVLLTQFKSDVSKLYFFDLIGAGLSCFAFVILMPLLGGNGTIVFVAAGGFLSALVFSYRSHKTIALISIILLIFIFAFLIDKDGTIPIRVTSNKIYGNYIQSRPDLKIFSGWNTFSKIDVMREEESSQDGYDVNLAIIDEGNATTNIPRVKIFPLKTKPADASNLSFVTKDTAENVFIIGSGGGGEILVSLYHKAKNIVGVEINGLLNELIEKTLAYWTGPLIKGNKNVKIITDDARSVIGSDSKKKYDVIVSAHTISSSAVSSGAMSMVENYILTKEAVKLYIEQLKNNGVIYISRPETQIPKLLSTFRQVVTELKMGDDRKNYIIFRRPLNSFETDKSFMAGIIYKKDGFKDQEIIYTRYEAIDLGLDIIYDPLSPTEGIFKKIIEADNIYDFVSGKKDLIPATDDKPFFDDNYGFGNLNWSNVKEIFSQDDKAILALKDKPVAEVTLGTMFLQILVISVLLLIFPLMFMKKRQKDEFEKKYLLYFAFLGLGYIMIQVSLIQRFTLLLGQPVYTMLTVISTMLFASGLGSKYSLRFFNNNIKRLRTIFIIITLLIFIIALLTQPLFNALTGWFVIFRIIITILIIFPLGFFMGMPFPLGITMIRDSESRYISFAWAINGFFSVIGTVLTIILAMILGFKFVFVFSGLIYIVAMLFITLRFKRILVYLQDYI